MNRVSMAQRTQTTARPRPARRPRGSLSREEIVNGAFELAEHEGIDSLSMLRLAKHLGVGVTSIYWYVRSKEDLLAALSEEAATRLYQLLPDYRECAWDEHLLRYFRDFRVVFRDNPVLCDLIVLRAPMQSRSPEAKRRFFTLLEREIGSLVDAGFPIADAVNIYMTLSVYTRGCVLNERIFSDYGRQAVHDGFRVSDPQIDLADLPVMAQAMEYWAPSFATDEKFIAGLGFILDGLRARLARPQPGDTQPGDTQPGDTQAGDTQAGDTGAPAAEPTPGG